MTTRPARRPTMADVGRMAGVSAATVSFVLNPASAQPISPATRARVLQAVADLDYRPNRTAQNLRRGRSGTLGLVIDEPVVETYSAYVLAGVHDVATLGGHTVLSTYSGRDPRVLQAGYAELADRPADAILVVCAGTRAVASTLPSGRPTLYVNAFDPTGTAPAFVPDDEQGGADAVRLLLEAGHRRIALLLGRKNAWATDRRLAGARRALAEAGLDPAAVPVHYGTYHLDSGESLAARVLQAADAPTGIVCGNDRMALGVYYAAAKLGLRIPEDVSVVGYDDLDPAVTQLLPMLTTVRLPLYEMGRLAAQSVIDQRLGEFAPVTWLPCPPVRRGSVTGPPPSR